MARSLNLDRIMPGLCLLILAAILANSAFMVSGSDDRDLKSELMGLILIKEEMNRSGLGTTRINELINEGFFYLNNGYPELTGNIIDEAYSLGEISAKAKEDLADAGRLLKEIEDSNSLQPDTDGRIILDQYAILKVESAKSELNKENYEESASLADSAKKMLLSAIEQKYSYLKIDLAIIEQKINSSSLSKSRILFLQSSLSSHLSEGAISGIKNIEQEALMINKAITSYAESAAYIPLLEEQGISSQRVKDSLTDAEKEINMLRYEEATQRLEAVRRISEDSLQLSAEITELQERLKEMLKESHETEGMAEEELILIDGTLSKAWDELLLGNYGDAKSLFESASADTEGLKAGLLISRSREERGQTVSDYLKEAGKYFLIAISAASIIILLAGKKIANQIRKTRLEKMRNELIILKEQVDELQKNYFIRKKISRDSYDSSYEELQHKIMQLREDIDIAENKQKH